MTKVSQREKGTQGFASLSKDRRREIASQGGRAAQKKGTAHRWNTNEARLAGRKGGKKKQKNFKNRQQASKQLKSLRFGEAIQPQSKLLDVEPDGATNVLGLFAGVVAQSGY